MKKILLITMLVFFTALTLPSLEESKKKEITNVDQLPRHSYKASFSVTHIVTDEKAFNAFAKEVRNDLENDLLKYDIKDKTALKQYLNSIVILDMLDGKKKSGVIRHRTSERTGRERGCKIIERSV